ncbi:MAG: sigma-54 dependent transcriptional regulator [Abyssibacter sp.]|uniref:sigma-54-dependent transcriptional regulator n=1 Tax=Abyssibacter sp. TaxID=2320200 RepID=UPI003219C96E
MLAKAATEGPRRALLIEDTPSLALVYQGYLRRIGFEVQWCKLGREGLTAMATSAPDLLLLDLQLPDMHGTEVLSALQEQGARFPRVVITAHGSVEHAVEAMRLGAADFLEKPFTAERLQITLDNVLDRVQLHEQVRVIREQIERDGYAGFVGRSLPMQVVYRIIDSAAVSRAPVFITGESGTGKELCAQAIHERSDRAEGPFIAVNCGAIPRELFESEIFGHQKGAFSGATRDRVGAAEQAHGGTLFLDEIGEMDTDLQVKLLRFLQSGRVQRVGATRDRAVDVRVVCATNRDPLHQISEGRFREDLYYRLNVIPIEMPPLRDRGDDVLSIADHFLSLLSAREGRPPKQLAPDVRQLLIDYDWPGNVRQLYNVIYNIVLLQSGPDVTAAMLPAALLRVAGDVQGTTTRGQERVRTGTERGGSPAAGILPLAVVEKETIQRAIADCDGNVPVAAAHLGVSPSTLYRKLKQWAQSPADQG